MTAVRIVVAVVWAVFWSYWLAAAFTVKRGRIAWSRELAIRAVLAALVIVLIRAGAFRAHPGTTGAWRWAVGIAMLASGLGFAVWARVSIGRNWGTPMSQKVRPDLVTDGPYRLVRHPIYSGILVGAAGTAIALNWTWLIGVALAAVYFGYSALVEERYMTDQFPEEYGVYKRSTKMLVPFVW